LPADYTYLVADNGIHTFTDGVTLTTTGNQTVTVTDTVGSQTGNQTVHVDPAAPNYMLFTVQPKDNTREGAIITPPVEVTLYDIYNNLCDNSSAAITVAIEYNPRGGVLSGTLTKNAVEGVAIFDDLAISKRGLDYTLNANSTGLAPVISAEFDITARGVAAWKGWAGTSDWNNPDNWDNNAVPTADYNLIIENRPIDPILDIDRTYNDILVESGAILDLNNKNLTLTGSMTIQGVNGLVPAAEVINPAAITVSADWNNYGTFTAGISIVTFISLEDSHIRGTTIFFDLTCMAAGKTIYFDSTTGTVQTITGTLTIDAAGDAIKIRSTTDGVQAHINPTGIRVINNVDVKDSCNDTATYILPYPTSSKDSGNNMMWFTPKPPDNNNPPPYVDPPYPIPSPDPDNSGSITTDPGSAISIGSDFMATGFQTDDEFAKRYRKSYTPGKYRTIVIVYEGRVAVADYENEKGPDYQKARSVKGGEKTETSGEVK